MKPIKDVVKMSQEQVKIVLEAPDADLPYVLSDYHVLVVPNGFEDWANPVGTGGYKAEIFDPGVRCILTNRGGYWKEGRCNLESAEITVINDDAARMQSLLAGEFDVTHRVVVPLVDQLLAAGNLELVQAAAGYHFIMPMMCDTKPYDNPDTRLAMKYAINRAKLVEMMFGKYARVGNDHPIPESDPFHNNELPQRQYDPRKLRSMPRRLASAPPTSPCRLRTRRSTARSTCRCCSRRPPARPAFRSRCGANRTTVSGTMSG